MDSMVRILGDVLELIGKFGAVTLFMLYFAYRDHRQRINDRVDRELQQKKYEDIVKDNLKIAKAYERVNEKVADILNKLVSICENMSEVIRNEYAPNHIPFPRQHHRTPRPSVADIIPELTEEDIEKAAEDSTTSIQRTRHV